MPAQGWLSSSCALHQALQQRTRYQESQESMREYSVWECLHPCPHHNTTPRNAAVGLPAKGLDVMMKEAKKARKANAINLDIKGWWKKHLEKVSRHAGLHYAPWGHAERTNCACVLTAGRFPLKPPNKKHPEAANRNCRYGPAFELHTIQQGFGVENATEGKFFQTWAMALESHTRVPNRWLRWTKTPPDSSTLVRKRQLWPNDGQCWDKSLCHP